MSVLETLACWLAVLAGFVAMGIVVLETIASMHLNALAVAIMEVIK